MDEQYIDNYISIDEAAEYLGIKTVTLRKMLNFQQGKLENSGSLSALNWMHGSIAEKAQLNKGT